MAKVERQDQLQLEQMIWQKSYRRYIFRPTIFSLNYFCNSLIYIFFHYYFQGGGGLVHQLRKSYSLTDLGHTENDYGATITEHRAITSDPGIYL